jgi:hypothetical protein
MRDERRTTNDEGRTTNDGGWRTGDGGRRVDVTGITIATRFNLNTFHITTKRTKSAKIKKARKAFSKPS